MEEMKGKEKGGEENAVVCDDNVVEVTARSEDFEMGASTSQECPNTSVQSPKSTTERVMKDVPCPPCHKLTTSEIFDEATGLPHTEKLKEHLLAEGRIDEQAALRIIAEATAIFRKEENIIKLNDPVTICGDIHGQFYDLMKLFDVGGCPNEINYLFLGDYVDRGNFSTECVLYLWALKICHPTTFFLLRGNHESRHLTEYFTFKIECELKYTQLFYDACIDSFNCLPLAAVVKKQFFCVHGGLSPELFDLNDIQKINRFQELPSHGIFSDLLWADPDPHFGKKRKKAVNFFKHNKSRGCSYYFSYEACCDFLYRNKLLSVIRAHQAQNEGYCIYRETKDNFFALMTIFSAPNYLGTYKNKGAVITYKNNILNIRQFHCMPHPFCLPNFVDVLTWSLPFVAEKVTDILVKILKVCSKNELLSNLAPRADVIRKKIRAVSKILRAYTTLREERELVLQLKGMSPTGRMAYGLLSGGRDSLKNALRKHLTFKRVRRMDAENEQIPKIRRSITLDTVADAVPANLPEDKSKRRHSYASPGGIAVTGKGLRLNLLYDPSRNLPRTAQTKDHSSPTDIDGGDLRPHSSPGPSHTTNTKNVTSRNDSPPPMLPLSQRKSSADDKDDETVNAKARETYKK